MLEERIPWYWRVLFWIIMTAICVVTSLAIAHPGTNWGAWLWYDLFNMLVFLVPLLVINCVITCENPSAYATLTIICRIWVVIIFFLDIGGSWAADEVVNGLRLACILVTILSCIFDAFTNTLMEYHGGLYDVLFGGLWIVSFGAGFLIPNAADGAFLGSFIYILLAALGIAYLMEILSFIRPFSGRRSSSRRSNGGRLKTPSRSDVQRAAAWAAINCYMQLVDVSGSSGNVEITVSGATDSGTQSMYMDELAKQLSGYDTSGISIYFS